MHEVVERLETHRDLATGAAPSQSRRDRSQEDRDEQNSHERALRFEKEEPKLVSARFSCPIHKISPSGSKDAEPGCFPRWRGLLSWRERRQSPGPTQFAENPS